MSEDAGVRIRFCEHCGSDFSWQLEFCPRCQLGIGSPIRHVVVTAAGVAFRNRDGTRRQQVLRELQARLARIPRRSVLFSEQLLLEADDDGGDSGSVGIVLENGPQIGHLDRETAEQVLGARRAGTVVNCLLIEVTPGRPDDPTLGARVLVLFTSHAVTAEEAQAYVREHEAAWR